MNINKVLSHLFCSDKIIYVRRFGGILWYEEHYKLSGDVLEQSPCGGPCLAMYIHGQALFEEYISAGLEAHLRVAI